MPISRTEDRTRNTLRAIIQHTLTAFVGILAHIPALIWLVSPNLLFSFSSSFYFSKALCEADGDRMVFEVECYKSLKDSGTALADRYPDGEECSQKTPKSKDLMMILNSG